MQVLGKLSAALYKDVEKLRSLGLLDGREALVTQAEVLAVSLDLKESVEKHKMFLEVLDALGIGRIVADSGNDDFNTYMTKMFSEKAPTDGS